MEEEAIKIQWDDETVALINKVSDLIIKLNLDADRNSELVGAITDMCNMMERKAYLQGFDMGCKTMKFAIEADRKEKAKHGKRNIY